MKLIYLSNARMPTEKAHGIHIMKMCEAFGSYADPKVAVRLVIPQRFNKIKDNPFDYYGMVNTLFKFPIIKLKCIDLIPYDKYIGRLGLWIESITFAVSVFRYLFFKDGRDADIIYIRDKSLLFLSFFKKNIIFEAHTFPRNYFLYSIFFKKLNKLIVITKKLKDLFINRGIVEEKILVSPDGVDLAMFMYGDASKIEVRKKLNLPQDTKITLYAGHLYSWKGVQTLAEAAKYLPEGIEVYFVGGTKEDIEKFKVRYSNIRNIIIVGHRSYSEIPLWLAAADVLILPNSGKEEISKSWTSPLKMFEYMASKRPIIASNLPSIGEILNENNSILIEPDNPSKLAENIKLILNNPDLAERISVQSFNDVQKYTWSKRGKSILASITLRN